MSSVNSAAPLGQPHELARNSLELNHPENSLGQSPHHTLQRGFNPNEFKALLLLSTDCVLGELAQALQITSALVETI